MTSERTPPQWLAAREAIVGDTTLRRLLPHPQRRRAGAWCFLDHFGPTSSDGGTVGPHPHTGIQTFTWLVEGRLVHGDSIGSRQTLVPGELNLMTAGRGIVHWEEAQGEGVMHGVQLWIALPEASRGVAPAFEHHVGLPRCQHGEIAITVLIGEHAGLRSPARAYSPIVGLDLVLPPGADGRVPLRADFEHALVVLDGTVEAGGPPTAPGQLGWLGQGRPEVALRSRDGARVLLLGGQPFDEPLLMWWNWVGRTYEDIADAHAEWQRLQRRSWSMPPVPAPALPARLLPR